MVPFPNSTAPAAVGSEGDEWGESTSPAPPPGGDPIARALFVGPDWQPVPSSYDWFGATDPEGLADDAHPLGGAAASPAPPAEAS